MCAQIGVQVISQETPPSVINANSTANAFMVGFADWGPGSTSGVSVVNPVTSLAGAAALVGAPNGGFIQNSRSATNATLYDAADVFFREGGATLYLSRVIGPSPTKGSLILQDGGAQTAATLTATYYGSGSSGIYVVITNATTTYTVKLQDVNGNVLASSPTLSNTNKADLISWAASTNLVTAAAGNSSLPATITSTPLSAGTDDHNNATLTHWQNALNVGFSSVLGPGQVMAPNQNNTSLPGIWSALGTHAQSTNRIALLDGTDGNSASSAIAEVTGAALPSSIQGYCGIWAGNVQVPGVVSGTTRVVPPSPVIAALCARADNQGNPNLACAGSGFPFFFVSGPNTAYTGPLTGDIATLNGAGINTFATIFQTFQNYGFVSALATPASDAIYWQLCHARLRMAIVNQGEIIAQPFVFSQLDGQNQDLASFAGALNGMLLTFYQTGALYGLTPTQAFTVNAGPTINTAASLQAGNLIAQIAVRMSPYAQLVQVTINAVPITQSLVQTSGTTV